jgi:methyltransferase (TIGR00027 family)
MLAAGFDARALRLGLPADAVVFEVDQAEVVRHKLDTMERIGARPGCGWKPIVANLQTSWEEMLLEQGFNASIPTVWLAEGLLYYLDVPLIRSIFDRARRLSGEGSMFVCDVVNELMINSPIPAVRDRNQRMKDVGSPMVSGINDPVAFLRESGWAVEKLAHPGEQEANFGRWPDRIPVIPREYPGWPRYFLLCAKSV